MEYQLIRTSQEWDIWLAARKSYYSDFDCDCPQLPVMVVWAEINYDPYIYWDVFSIDRLNRAIKRLETIN